MGVTSLYTNITQAKGINKVCTVSKRKHLDWFFRKTHSNSTNKITCYCTEPPWAPKMILAFVNIFMAEIEMQILNKSTYKEPYGNATSTT